jgi:hypothetical protein
MQEITLRSVEIPARDWTLQLGDELVLLPPQGEPLRVTRADLPRAVELLPTWGQELALVVRPQGRKKVSFRVLPEQRTVLEAWLGPPTAEHLRHVLRRRYAFTIPLALIFILASLPLPAEPGRGIPAHSFDWVGAILGFGLLGLWLLARLRPTPVLFLVDGCWFALAMLSNVWAVYRGVSSPWWLVFAALLGWLAISGFKQYRQHSRAASPSVAAT